MDYSKPNKRKLCVEWKVGSWFVNGLLIGGVFKTEKGDYKIIRILDDSIIVTKI